jgi:hypothetical protein
MVALKAQKIATTFTTSWQRYGGPVQGGNVMPPSVAGMAEYFESAACEECAAVFATYPETGHVVANVDDETRTTFAIWLHAHRFA